LNRVHIEGPEAALDAVRLMPQTIVYGGEDVEPGRGRLFAYVESADIPAIEALGATVTVVVSEAEREAKLNELYARLEDDEPPVA
jgi:hypothetical protein